MLNVLFKWNILIYEIQNINSRIENLCVLGQKQTTDLKTNIEFFIKLNKKANLAIRQWINIFKLIFLSIFVLPQKENLTETSYSIEKKLYFLYHMY